MTAPIPVPQAVMPAVVFGQVTGTVMVQPAAGKVAPVKLMLFALSGAVKVPPGHVVLAVPLICKGAGSASMTFKFEASCPTMLFTLIVKVVVSPGETVLKLKLFEICPTVKQGAPGFVEAAIKSEPILFLTWCKAIFENELPSVTAKTQAPLPLKDSVLGMNKPAAEAVGVAMGIVVPLGT